MDSGTLPCSPRATLTRSSSLVFAEGVYVDLLENPERFTGYAGDSSSRVWKAIYEENCFTPVPYIDPSRSTSEGGTGFAPINSFGMTTFPSPGSGAGGWGDGEKKLIGTLAGPRDGGDEICLEKRVFYRVISGTPTCFFAVGRRRELTLSIHVLTGLHASISIHICDDYLDQKTGEWVRFAAPAHFAHFLTSSSFSRSRAPLQAPNLQCFVTRIAQHPERLQNVYFTYVLLLRALSKSGPQLLRTLQDTSSESETISKLESLIQVANGCPSTFDETSMFSGSSSQVSSLVLLFGVLSPSRPPFSLPPRPPRLIVFPPSRRSSKPSSSPTSVTSRASWIAWVATSVVSGANYKSPDSARRSNSSSPTTASSPFRSRRPGRSTRTTPRRRSSRGAKSSHSSTRFIGCPSRWSPWRSSGHYGHIGVRWRRRQTRWRLKSPR
jgi:hypothetical protein